MGALWFILALIAWMVFNPLLAHGPTGRHFRGPGCQVVLFPLLKRRRI